MAMSFLSQYVDGIFFVVEGEDEGSRTPRYVSREAWENGQSSGPLGWHGVNVNGPA